MTLPALIIPILMAAAAPVADPPQPVKLEFPLAGYRINAFDSTSTDFIFTMFLPVSKDSSFFKVNVDGFTLKGGNATWQKNVKESKIYYKQAGFTIVSESTPSPTEWQVEFITKGDRAGRGPNDHIYERWIFANGKSYWIRATSRDAQWAELGAKFKACVDSFELTPEPGPGKVSFPQRGFRIGLLDETAPADARQQLLLGGIPLPTAVNIAPYAKTLKDFQAERKPPYMQDSKHKFKILAESSPAENALVTLYAEEFPGDKKNPQGGQLLTYEKVFLAHGHLYEVSTHLYESNLQSVAQLKAWVDSLEEMPATAPAPGPTPVPAPAPAK